MMSAYTEKERQVESSESEFCWYDCQKISHSLFHFFSDLFLQKWLLVKMVTVIFDHISAHIISATAADTATFSSSFIHSLISLQPVAH